MKSGKSRNNDRPAIPKAMKREVRQKCGFGCVICGCPIYDYDHIKDYAIVKKHEASNLVLLCPTCHRKKTNGILTEQKIKEVMYSLTTRLNTSPDNIPIENYSIDIGGNLIETFSGCIFDIYELGNISISFNQELVINGVIFDENGNKAIEIKNSIYTLSSKTWDIEFIGKTLTFRNAPRKVFASIEIDGKNKKISFRCDFLLKNKVWFKVSNKGIFADKNLLARGNTILNTNVALLVTSNDISEASVIGGYCKNSYFHGVEGIAALNLTNAYNNYVESCNYAFVWTVRYLLSFDDSFKENSVDRLFCVSLGAGKSSLPPSLIKRSSLCPCGSSKRYKHCHGKLRK